MHLVWQAGILFFVFSFIEKLYPPDCFTVPPSLQAQGHRPRDCNKGQVLCILTSFWVLHAPVSWWKHIFISLAISLSLSHYFFPSFGENVVTKNFQLALERGRKSLRVTQYCLKHKFLNAIKYSFQKSSKGTWKCLLGHFLTPGSVSATPALDLSIVNLQKYIMFVLPDCSLEGNAQQCSVQMQLPRSWRWSQL